MKEVYVIICRNKSIKDWTGNNISQECYDNIDKAINFCESKLTQKELEEHKKKLNRKLISWYEFDSKTYKYEIKVLSVK